MSSSIKETVQIPPSEFFDSNGYSIEYKLYGSRQAIKPWVLCFHGLGGSAESMKYVAPHVRSKNILCISLPHHGRTKLAPPASFNLVSFIFTVQKLVKHLNLDISDLLSHSIGSSYALMYAIQFPESIRTIHLLCPPGFGERDKYFFKFFGHPIGKFICEFEAAMQWMTKKLYPNKNLLEVKELSPRIAASLKEIDQVDLNRLNLVYKLYNIGAQVNILWGDKDLLMPQTNAYEVKNHFRLANVYIAKNKGHNLLKQCPNEIANLINS